MKPALIEFQRATEDLARLLCRAAVEEELLRADLGTATPEGLRETLISFRRAVDPFVLRQAQYAMQLMLLYSAFERMIEGFLVGSVTTLNDLVPTYPELPPRIQDNHRRKSLDLLRDDVWLARHNDPPLAAKLIEGLHSCEAHASHYRLNGLAYARHSGNFRRTSIEDAFRDAGVDSFLRLTADTDEFKAYLAADLREKGLFDAEFRAIDDMAERRNEIAHGNPAQILTREQMRDYIDFFNAFAHSCYAALRRHLARFLVAHHVTSVVEVDHVHYKRVVCLNLGALPAGTWVEVGDPVAVDCGFGSGYDIGRITNIRTDDGDVRGLRAASGVMVCIETSLPLRLNRQVFLVDRHCPAAWMLD